ncbi:MAG: ATP-binding cassette domain-containing protein [Actinobacteria bacterium]|nr:ATP-binding cassette domain-containing protein [Actinomycetota bacterium]
MEIIIKVENLGKKYIISHQTQDRYLALRDVIASGTKKVVKTIAGKPSLVPKKENLWALRNIDFNIEQGDRVGIIGRNGAGKSTLLKLLSRITEPSEGKIAIKGRVSSLLEVGTGFHPELTGRENVYLNGAILGMGKQEIKKKFDEIVDFAEIEKFLDTPVKRYSSGMYVRLAFAVAAHLDSEILVIDEVLAVGDAQFQKKCLGKMDSVSLKEGRTVLFVSHNMGIIRNLCNHGILLDRGEIKYKGDMEETISTYEYENQNILSIWKNNKDLDKTDFFDIENVVLLDEKGNSKREFFNSESIIIKMDVIVKEIHSKMLILLFFTKHGETAFTYPIFLASKNSLKKGKQTVFLEIQKFLLNEGTYFITIDNSLHCIQGLAKYENILNFEVRFDKMEGMPALENVPGYVFPLLNWRLEE